MIPIVEDFIQATRARLKEQLKYEPDEKTVVNFAEAKRLISEMDQKCKFCGEKILSEILTDDEIKEVGYKLYEEYKKFMGTKDMPKEILIEVTEPGSYIGSCRFDKDLGKFIVTINKNQKYCKSDIYPIFFHEFTHVYDRYDVKTGGEKSEKDLLGWFAECHATEVELMARLNFSNSNVAKNLQLSSKLISV